MAELSDHNGSVRIEPFEKTADGLEWYDCRALEVEGRGWRDVKQPYDRLPASAESRVDRKVWTLGRHSAGLFVRFRTDSPTVHARWGIRFRISSSHMPDSGVAGLDLYAADGERWRWVGTGLPSNKGVRFEYELARGTPDGDRDYLLYLPIFSPVRYLHIGLAPGASFNSVPPTERPQSKPICVHGTCFSQGASVSRPGKTYASIMGRNLRRTVFNLGFSGHAFMDQSVADLMTELDCEAYVIDCAPNMTPDMIRERTPEFLETLARSRPHAAIIVVDSAPYENEWFLAGQHQLRKQRNMAIREAVDSVRDPLLSPVRLVRTVRTLEPDIEYGVADHACDMGHHRMARRLSETITNLAKESESTERETTRDKTASHASRELKK